MTQTTDTSRAALRAIEPELPPWREQIYDIIATSEGITCREIAFRIHKESGFVSARLSELEEEGRIVRGEKRKDRFTDVEAYVWLAGTRKPTFAGFQAYLRAQGLGNSDLSEDQRSRAYQAYLKSI